MEKAAWEAKERLEGHEAAVCDIVVAEVVAGARNQREGEHWCAHLTSNYHVLPFTMGVSLRFRELIRGAWKHRGARISDHLVAATALAHDCSLLTLNKKDFERIKGLKLL
ncbi:MAG: PIN domain-containing protein [Flavobacteriales bacterium]